MAINNTPKPTGSVNNTAKVSTQVTWDSNTNTWNTETRTWDQMYSALNNTAKVTGTVNNTPKPSA